MCWQVINNSSPGDWIDWLPQAVIHLLSFIAIRLRDSGFSSAYRKKFDSITLLFLFPQKKLIIFYSSCIAKYLNTIIQSHLVVHLPTTSCSSDCSVFKGSCNILVGSFPPNFSLTHVLRNVLLSFLKLGNFLNIFLLPIFNLILLWSWDIFCMSWILWNLLRFVLPPKI